MLLKKTFYGLVCLLVAFSTLAHPPTTFVVNEKGEAFIADFTRNRILKIDSEGNKEVFFEDKEGDTLPVPHHIVMDEQGFLYSVGDHGGKIIRFAQDGSHEQIFPPENVHATEYIGAGGNPFTLDRDGNFYALQSSQYKFSKILKITPVGMITNFAGNGWGIKDGPALEADFKNLHSSSFAWGTDGSLYLTDSGSHIRRITTDGVVETLVGNTTEKKVFSSITGIAIDEDGIIYVADSSENAIKKVDSKGNITVFAAPADHKDADENTIEAEFNDPWGIAIGPNGSLYILEYYSRDSKPRLWRITAEEEVEIITE